MWIACAAFTVLTTSAHAQSIWNGITNDWFTGTNWSTNAVPTGADEVRIDTVTPNAAVIGAGAATSQAVRIGYAAATTGQLTVTGAGTTLTNSGGMFVGQSGTGTLTIQNGAQVTTQAASVIGASPGASGTANVTGAGSVWNVNSDLNIGLLAATGTLNISNSGTVNTTVTYVGASAGSTGIVNVNGAGSTWNSSGDLNLGWSRSGTLNITNGGVVNTSSVLTLGYLGGTGALIVDGAGSRFSNSAGGIGVSSGSVTVSNGGSVTTVGGVVGTGNATGQALVDGTNSRWTVTGALTIGNFSFATGIVTLRNGGTVSADALEIARVGATGTLNIGAASGAAAAAPGTLSAPTVTFGTGSGRIVFNHTALNYAFTPVISGLGTLLVEAGTTSITSNSAAFTGNTIVNGGTLLANGSMSSSTTRVNSGGTLGGTGLIGNTFINGGTLSPGNSIGTLNVQGNLAFTSASTYLIEVDPNGSDRTNVNVPRHPASATLRATYANGSYVSRRYTILTAAGGVIGTFNSVVNTNLPANFATALNYDATNAYLDITLNFAPADPTAPNAPTSPNFGAGLSGNQRNVAGALVNSFNTAGGIPLVFGALTPQGLTQVSGESTTGAQQTTFNAMDHFIGMMTDPFLGTRAGGAPQAGASGYADEDDVLAYAAKKKRTGAERDAYAAFKAPPRPASFERRWSVWGSGYGGTQKTDGNAVAGSNDLTSRIYGGAAGFDYRLSPDTLVGFSLGGAGTNYGLADGLGSGRSEMFQAGLYGRHTFGAAYLAAALAYGWQDATTDRNVFGNVYRANFDASSLAGRLEGGYRFAFGASGVTPYAAGQFTSFWLPGYAEQTVAGTNIFALGFAAKDVTASRSELGLRGDTSFVHGDAIVTLRGRAAWAHNFNTDRSIGVIFQTLPASAFVVNGAALAHDSALVSAGAEAKWLNGFSVAATFEGEFSKVTESYAGKGTLRYQW